MHPRYGDKPVKSDFNFSREEIERAHWRYSSLRFFPESAIPADISKQNFSMFPRKLYIDIEQQCELCKRRFLFFALEQKYWFEELGLYVDAHCTLCIDCRIKDREIRNMQKLYQELVNKENRSVEETKKLRQAALELYQIGCIKDKNKIDQIK